MKQPLIGLTSFTFFFSFYCSWQRVCVGMQVTGGYFQVTSKHFHTLETESSLGRRWWGFWRPLVHAESWYQSFKLAPSNVCSSRKLYLYYGTISFAKKLTTGWGLRCFPPVLVLITCERSEMGTFWGPYQPSKTAFCRSLPCLCGWTRPNPSNLESKWRTICCIVSSYCK